MQYKAPAWLKNSHAQTIWPLLIQGARPPMKRKRWNTPDGDFIDLDFLPRQDGRPLLILFHGLEGSSQSHYARSIMRAAFLRHWNAVVVHFRACSGESNRLARGYHAGDTEELDWVLRKLARRYPDVPRYAAGVSLGGNALLCWLGKQGPSAHKQLDKAVAISAPLDLAAAGEALEQGFSRIYAQYLLRSMRRSASKKAERFPDLFDAPRAINAKTLREFDDAYTAPLHGFQGVADYWAKASSKPLLQHIALPTLILNARNDPFLPAKALPGRFEVSPMVLLEQPEEGGHVGFVTGAFPGKLDWLPERLMFFFDER